MKKERTNRSRLVGVRFTPQEFQRLEEWRAKSTTNETSELVRRIIFQKPITFYQRNQSLDDFMAEMIHLRTELNAVGNNFNQAVKKLHTLTQIREFQQWVQQYEQDKQLLLEKVGAIKDRVNQLSDQWLQ